MNQFNNILENIKKMMSSIYGKLIIVIFIIIALATFFLARVQNNDTAFSFLRGIMSSIISCLVILGTYFLITKIVGKEVIESNKSNDSSDISETDEFNFSNDDNSGDPVSNDNISTTSDQNDESMDKFDISALDGDKTSIMDKLNSVDKNPKVSYPNKTDTSNAESTESVSLGIKSSIGKPLSDDSFIDFSSPAPKTTGDTETMAKAVRTMRSKDNE